MTVHKHPDYQQLALLQRQATDRLTAFKKQQRSISKIVATITNVTMALGEFSAQISGDLVCTAQVVQALDHNMRVVHAR